MKKFTKLFLSCAAVAAVTAAVATSAMAAEVALQGEVAGKYDTATGMLTITAPTDLLTGTQATLLVLPASVDPTKNTVSSSDVVGIDQGANAAFTNAGLKGAPQVPDSGNTKYKVYLGYYKAENQFSIAESTLLLGKEDGKEIKIGDANLDGKVLAQDASMVLSAAVGLKAGIGNVGDVYTNTETNATFKIGDANLDGKVLAQDASMVLSAAVGLKDGIGSVNTVVNAAPAE